MSNMGASNRAAVGPELAEPAVRGHGWAVWDDANHNSSLLRSFIACWFVLGAATLRPAYYVLDTYHLGLESD
jgi:hypothetical protein